MKKQSPELQTFNSPALIPQEFSVLRLDLPDPAGGGNKYYKLKYNLAAFADSGCEALLTFGGAYSNHIAATALAGKRNNIRTIGIIRGDELHSDSNQVLRFASQCGMRFEFVSRTDYRKRGEHDFHQMLKGKFGNVFIVPEGGSNEFAIKGCEEIMNQHTESYEHIFLPVGTGGTTAGIIRTIHRHQTVHGIAVLNGAGYLEEEVTRLAGNPEKERNWELHHEFTFGGYGRYDDQLVKFIREVKSATGIPLDHVYSGKALFGMAKITAEEKFRGKKILFVHTGGYAFAPDYQA